MPFARPTLSELVTRIRSDFRGRLEIQGALLRRAMADVLAVVWAGGVHMLHGHLEWLGEQLNATRSVREFLLEQAALYGITPIPATFASGLALATGTDSSVIPVDTILVRDDAVTYRVTAEKTIAGGQAFLSLQAAEAGVEGNLGIGETLTFESPIAGVDATATVINDESTGEGIAFGNDEEDTEGTRARLLLRLQEPPQGGADQDYVAWALAVVGVTRVWVFAHENGLGTVVVRFVRDNDVDIFPDNAEVLAVQTALDGQRPITADVTALAPIPLAVNFTISITPDTSSIRTAVEAELTDLLAREAEPGDGAGRGTILLSKIRTAIGVGVGDGDYTQTVPNADMVPAVGELAVMGVVTWV